MTPKLATTTDKAKAFNEMGVHIHDAATLANAMLLAVVGADRGRLNNSETSKALEVMATRVANQAGHAWRIWEKGAGIP